MQCLVAEFPSMETGCEWYESNHWAKALAVKLDVMSRNTIIVYGLKVPGLRLHYYQNKDAVLRIAKVRVWLRLLKKSGSSNFTQLLFV